MRAQLKIKVRKAALRQEPTSAYLSEWSHSFYSSVLRDGLRSCPSQRRLRLAILISEALRPASVSSRGGFIAALIGVMSICSELRHGDDPADVCLLTPNRSRVLIAKLISSLALGAAFGRIAEALASPSSAWRLAIRGIHVVVPTREFLFVAVGEPPSPPSWQRSESGLAL